MIYSIYEWHLLCNLSDVPQVVCFMISDCEMKEEPAQVQKIIKWCLEISDKVQKNCEKPIGIREIIIHISTPFPDRIPPYLSDIRKLSSIATIHLHYGKKSETFGSGAPVTIAIGKSGREEISDAIKAMVTDSIAPEQVTTKVLEKYLTFLHTPDCVIKTGGAHLVDFLIWQSVYSDDFSLT